MPTPKYVPASEVTSPRRQWSLIAVLDDPKQPNSGVLALGRWDDEPVLAMRWNGNEDNPVGNPQSRGLPTWFIVPHAYHEALLNSGRLAPDMLTLARNFIKPAAAAR